MALDVLSLPIDIPWQRLTTSRDMMAGALGFDRFPLKWRSSISIFYYQPTVDPTQYPDGRLLYFKVVFSITGHQSQRHELPVQTTKPDEWQAAVWLDVQDFLRVYYPCVAALAQVAFLPGDGRPLIIRRLSDYPLIMDFEPKKREVFEAVTMTGEAMSRSAVGLQLTKGNSTTRSVESTDTESGSITAGVAVPVGPVAVGVSGTYSSASGTSKGWSNTQVEISQVDSAREKRESLSHTTQLTQMYHELDSYHVGTNRALFAIFPRPHILPNQLTDDPTDGLAWVRKLEGIQEFFFVVHMPLSNDMICVEAHLDTMHVRKDVKKTSTPVFDTTEKPENVRDIHWFPQPNDPVIHVFKEVHAPPGFRIDKSKGAGGYDEHITGYVNCSHVVQVFQSYIRIDISYLPPTVPATTPGTTIPSASGPSSFNADYVLYCVSETVRYVDGVATDVRTFSTGRHLQSCLSIEKDKITPIEEGPGLKELLTEGYVTFEKPLPKRLWEIQAQPKPKDDAERIRLANRFGRELKEILIASVNSPDRYAIGEHSILDTDFAARALLHTTLESGIDVEQRVRIPDDLQSKLGRIAIARLESMKLEELIATPAAQLAQDLGVDTKGIIEVKLAQAGVPRERKPRGGEPNRGTASAQGEPDYRPGEEGKSASGAEAGDERPKSATQRSEPHEPDADNRGQPPERKR